MSDDNSTIKKDKADLNMLKFTCPKCGSHRLEEMVLWRHEIEGVYDPEDPAYDWHGDPEEMVVITRPAYAAPYDANHHRCYDCETSLRDEEGYEFWEPALLYRWLKGLPVSGENEIEEESD